MRNFSRRRLRTCDLCLEKRAPDLLERLDQKPQSQLVEVRQYASSCGEFRLPRNQTAMTKALQSWRPEYLEHAGLICSPCWQQLTDDARVHANEQESKYQQRHQTLLAWFNNAPSQRTTEPSSDSASPADYVWRLKDISDAVDQLMRRGWYKPPGHDLSFRLELGFHGQVPSSYAQSLLAIESDGDFFNYYRGDVYRGSELDAEIIIEWHDVRSGSWG